MKKPCTKPAVPLCVEIAAREILATLGFDTNPRIEGDITRIIMETGGLRMLHTSLLDARGALRLCVCGSATARRDLLHAINNTVLVTDPDFF